MTAPLAHGYPDWTRQTPAADVIYSAGFGHAAPAFTQLGPFFTGATPAVGLFFRANADAFRVQPTFWADKALTGFLAGQVLEFARAGVEFWGAIRTLGPWMTLDVTPFGGAGSFDWTLWQAPSPATIFNTHTDPRLIEVPGTAIGIGATSTFDATKIHVGRAHLYLAQRAGTYNGSLFSIDSLGVARRIVSRAMAAGEYFDEMVPLLGGTIRAQVVNTSGVASSLDIHVVAEQNMTG